MREGGVSLSVEPHQQGERLSGDVIDKGREYYPNLVIDADQRIIRADCTCNFYQQNRLYKGPCEHMLALRMVRREKISF